MGNLQHSIIAALLVATAAAQSLGLPVMWLGARAAIVRDSLYFDGGIFTTTAGKLTESDSVAQSQLNFSTPFNQTSNFTQLVQFSNYTTNDPLYKSHLSGFMFADNDEWYTFGGMAYHPADQTTADSDIIWYGIYQPIGATSAPIGGHANWQPPSGSNLSHPHVTNGAGVNVPSEKLGFYFSGLRSANDTDMSFNAPLTRWDGSSKLVNSMIMVNTSSYQYATFQELPLPDGIARAEATLAWVPVGTHGALIVIGGSPYPSDVFGTGSKCTLNSTYTSQNSQAQTVTNMTHLSVYDIAGETWYIQETNGATPPPLNQASAVVASAPNNVSHNIYVYGGYPGNMNSSVASDDVWILSVPTFTWIHVPSNATNHGRTGHVCAKPYPDQMMVIGGAAACGGNLNNTLFADVFNLTSLTWTDGTYDPSIWSNYAVPTSVSNAIASASAANMNSGLTALFKTAYPGKEPQYYPYPVISTATSGPAPNATAPATPPSSTPQSANSKKAWLIPVAVVVPIVGVLLIALAIFCCCIRRKGSSDSKQSRTMSWIRGQPAGKSLKSEDETTQVDSLSPGPHEIIGDSYFKRGGQDTAAELNGGLIPTSYNGFSSQRPHPHSPGSNYSGSELHSHSIPAELPTEMSGFTAVTPNIRNHHMYPPSLGRHGSSNHSKSVSSPNTDAITSYGTPQPQNSKHDKPLDSVPDDMVLDRVQSGSPQLVPARTQPSPLHMATTVNTGNVSPEPHPVDRKDLPITPPQQFTDTMPMAYNHATIPHRPFHTRNTSSLSSGITDMSTTVSSAVEARQQHFTTISPVTGSPNTVRSAGSPLQQSPRANPGLGLEEQLDRDSGIKRKEIGTSEPHKPNTLEESESGKRTHNGDTEGDWVV